MDLEELEQRGHHKHQPGVNKLDNLLHGRQGDHHELNRPPAPVQAHVAQPPLHSPNVHPHICVDGAAFPLSPDVRCQVYDGGRTSSTHSPASSPAPSPQPNPFMKRTDHVHLQMEVDAARRETDLARREMESTREEARRARAEVEGVRAQVEGLMGTIEALRGEKEHMQGAMESMHVEMKGYRGEIQGLRDALRATRAEREAASREVGQLQGQLVAARQAEERAVQWAHDEIQRAQAEAKDHANSGDSSGDVDDIRVQVVQLQRDNEAYRAEISALREALRDARAHREQMEGREEVEGVWRERERVALQRVDEYRQAWEEARAQAQALQGQVEERSRGAQEEIERVRGALRQVRAEREAADRAHAGAVATLRALQADLLAATAQRDAMARELEAAREPVARLDKGPSRGAEGPRHEVEGLRAEVLQLRGQLREVRAATNQNRESSEGLKDRACRAEQQAARAEEALMEARERQAEADSRAEEAQARAGAAEARVARLCEQVEVLTSQVDSLHLQLDDMRAHTVAQPVPSSPQPPTGQPSAIEAKLGEVIGEVAALGRCVAEGGLDGDSKGALQAARQVQQVGYVVECCVALAARVQTMQAGGVALPVSDGSHSAMQHIMAQYKAISQSNAEILSRTDQSAPSTTRATPTPPTHTHTLPVTVASTSSATRPNTPTGGPPTPQPHTKKAQPVPTTTPPHPQRPATATPHTAPAAGPSSIVSATRPSSIVSATRPSSIVSATRPSSIVSATCPSSVVSTTRPSSIVSATRPSSVVSATRSPSVVSAHGKARGGAKTPTGQASSDAFSVGDRVGVKAKRGLTGTVRYVGGTDFAEGTWYGLELSKCIGKNNGTVNGRQYFACADNCGLFVTADKLERLAQ